MSALLWWKLPVIPSLLMFCEVVLVGSFLGEWRANPKSQETFLEVTLGLHDKKFWLYKTVKMRAILCRRDWDAEIMPEKIPWEWEFHIGSRFYVSIPYKQNPPEAASTQLQKYVREPAHTYSCIWVIRQVVFVANFTFKGISFRHRPEIENLPLISCINLYK